MCAHQPIGQSIFARRSINLIFRNLYATVGEFLTFKTGITGGRHWRSQGRGHVPPEIGFTLHKKIPGCAVELNTQNCAWFGSQISLLTAMSFREAMPPEPPTRGSAPGPRWGTSVPQTPCATHLQILATPLVDVSVSEQWQHCGLARTVLLLSDEYMNVPVLYTLCSC